MYTPKVNAEERLPVLFAMMAAHPLAAVITMGPEGLLASHIPLVHESDGSPYGVLKGHVSKANTQWKESSAAVDALAVFTGPEHYISAGWYPAKAEHGREVPTWNYVAVHAHGPLRMMRDKDWLMAHLQSLTDQVEAPFTPPWKVTDAPADYISNLLDAIVGFELPIRRLEGKWKVSQNRNDRDRQAVMEGLERLNTPAALTMKDLVAGKR
jgi:transcriptional regulator